MFSLSSSLVAVIMRVSLRNKILNVTVDLRQLAEQSSGPPTWLKLYRHIWEVSGSTWLGYRRWAEGG